MLDQTVEDRIRAVAGMNGNVGVEEIGHGGAGWLFLPPYRDIDRLPFLDTARLGHAPKRGHNIAHIGTGGKNGDDVAETGDFQIEIRIRVGQFCRYPNGLAVAGFEGSSPRHGRFLCCI